MSLIGNLFKTGVNVIKTPLNVAQDVVDGTPMDNTVDGVEDTVDSLGDAVEDFFEGDWF